MSKRRLLFAGLVMLATMAATIFLPGAPPMQAEEELETECRKCVQACPSADFCWCAIDWCGDVCSKPGDCKAEQ